MPKSSKLWWKFNRELLNRKSKSATIPPLKASDGSWCFKPIDKANRLAATFLNKWRLPPGTWRIVREASRHLAMSDFHLIRSRWVSRIIKTLDVDKACGPDLIPIRILKECVKELSPVIAVLTRFLFKCRRRPQRWRLHWVHPLHKKGSVSDSSNYLEDRRANCGVHSDSIS